MSDSVRPHRWQPTRLRRPWDSPGKNTGVGCHFLLQCRKVKSESDITQSCLTPRDPMDCSPPGSSVHGIFQARVLEWGAIAFSCLLPKRKDPRDYTGPIWRIQDSLAISRYSTNHITGGALFSSSQLLLSYLAGEQVAETTHRLSL